MARSHSVYVVVGLASCAPGSEEILAGFTVKHELVAWLKANNRTPSDTSLYTMRDGGRGHVMEMQWPE